MDEFAKTKERNIEHLRLENEEADQKVSLAQKKAIEREARERYGRDWKKVVGAGVKAVRSIRPNYEVIHDLYGLGLTDLKESSRPRPMRRMR